MKSKKNWPYIIEFVEKLSVDNEKKSLKKLKTLMTKPDKFLNSSVFYYIFQNGGEVMRLRTSPKRNSKLDRSMDSLTKKLNITHESPRNRMNMTQKSNFITLGICQYIPIDKRNQKPSTQIKMDLSKKSKAQIKVSK